MMKEDSYRMKNQSKIAMTTEWEKIVISAKESHLAHANMREEFARRTLTQRDLILLIGINFMKAAQTLKIYNFVNNKKQIILSINTN